MTEAPQQGAGAAERDLAAFQRLREAFAAAAGRAGGVVSVFVEVAAHTIRLELAGEAMAPVVHPALAHRRVPPSPAPDLTEMVWDSASTGTSLPALPGGGGGRLHGPAPGRIQKVHQQGVHVFSVLDTERSEGVLWVPDAAAVPSNEVACPLRVLFHLYFRLRALRLVHAAGVGTGHGGVLLAGRSGQGKSTAALACLGGPLRLEGVDYVLLGPREEPRVHGLYASAKLNPDQLHRFPDLRPALANAAQVPAEKPVFLLHEGFRTGLIASFPLRAVVVPRVEPSLPSPRLTPLTGAELLAHIAPSTIFQLPFTGAGTLRWLARTLETVPAYTMEVGEDVGAVSGVLEGLLAGERGHG